MIARRLSPVITLTLLRLCFAPVPARATMCYHDNDGDGYGDIGDLGTFTPNPFCEPGFADNNLDCDDLDATVYPGAPELCDGKDNDCNGTIDDGLGGPIWYYDADGDGYGRSDITVQACAKPLNYADNDLDCNDYDGNSYPGAPEICDGKDNNCDGQIDEGFPHNTYYLDADGDGYGDFAHTISACAAPPGYVDNSVDCDDADSTVHPNATEICNSRDDNCNGTIDEGAADRYWFRDMDGDGYGDIAYAALTCPQPAGYVASPGDCNDHDSTIHPGATEWCDGIDNNCTGGVDENCVTCPVTTTGDVNISGSITSADIIVLVNFVFKAGQTPFPCEMAGDVNCNGAVTSSDIIVLVNHVFKAGPAPCDVCTLYPGTWSCP